jgi:hypothetical protein
VIPFKALRNLTAKDWQRPSVIALLLANLVPVFGVFFLGWEVFPLMFLFWAENLVIGAMNVLKMLMAQPGSGVTWAGKLFLVPFFCVHYGMFTLVHGLFVLTLFGREGDRPRGGPSVDLFVSAMREYHLGWAVAGLVISHGVSLVSNYINGGEYRRAEVGQLMSQPYGRIFVLHIALLAGGFLMAALNSPVAGLLVLIALKIVFDLAAHLAERKKFAGPFHPPRPSSA